jgi:two-component system, cell cycle response regulator
MKVLIADDEPGTRLLLATTLERLGHACVAAEDGDQAWERFLEEEPAMVVTDWQMPGLDGTEIARRIRERPAAAYTYVVVLTGAADESSARAAMEAGADDVLLKPLDAADLERKLIAADRVTAMHRRLHADARHDPLTGIGNRLRLAEDLEAVCGRVERYGHAYFVAIADVDHFKAYNDAHGHPRGDDVLRAVASSLRDTVRTGDTVYRYGGEEFVVLLRNTSVEAVPQTAERLRHAVGDVPVVLTDDLWLTTTVSVGGAAWPVHANSADELVRVADQALYAAKRLGRNRVQIGRPPGGAAVVQEHDEDAVLVYLQRLADEIDARLASEEHSAAIARWVGTIADHLGLGPDARWRAELAGRLHDIGKIIVTDEILLKPGPLTGGEWAVLRRHPVQGARLVGLAEGLHQVAAVVRQHHERFDGTGYPDGRTGEEIRIESRVVAVCDAWAAIRSNRPYDAARPVGAAREQLRVASGSQFDPTVVAAFLELEQAGVIGTFEAAPVRSSTARLPAGRSP